MTWFDVAQQGVVVSSGAYLHPMAHQCLMCSEPAFVSTSGRKPAQRCKPERARQTDARCEDSAAPLRRELLADHRSLHFLSRS